MFRLWLTLRRIRQRATPRQTERGEMLAYLRKAGAFSGVSKQSVYTFARMFTAVATLVLIVCVSLSSYAYASDDVLPDTVLYPVRQVMEEVEVRLAVTPVRKQKVVQKFVERRKKEVKILEEKKRPVPIKLKKFLQDAGTVTTTSVLRVQERRHRILENIKHLERSREDKLFTPRQNMKVTSTSTHVLLATSTRYARPSPEERKEGREQIRQKQEEMQKAKRLERQQQLKQRQEAARQKRLLQQRLRERQRE